MIYIVIGMVVCLIVQIASIQSSLKELKDDVQNLREHVHVARDRAMANHDYTHELIDEANNKLDILITPIEDNIANVAKKLFLENSTVEKEN